MDIRKIDKKTASEYVIKIANKVYGSNALEVKYLGGGSYGMAFKLKLDREPYTLVIKLYKVSGMHRTEQMQIDTLSKHSTIKFPKVLFVYDESKDVPLDALGMEFIEGACGFNPLFMFKPKGLRKQFSDAIVNNSLRLHSVANDKFGYLDNPCYNTWQEFYLTIVKEVIEGATNLVNSNKLNKKYLDLLQYCQKNYNKIFSDKVAEAVLIHGDLNVANIMVNSKTLEPVAIIDPFNSMWADREYDLFQFHNFMNKTFGIYDNYKNKYSVSDKCDLKVAVYALFNEILCYIKSGWTLKILLHIQYKNLLKQLKIYGI